MKGQEAYSTRWKIRAQRSCDGGSIAYLRHQKFDDGNVRRERTVFHESDCSMWYGDYIYIERERENKSKLYLIIFSDNFS